MATIYPFRALRPQPANASRIAAVPYDVINTDEARKIAHDNPLSFLRVSRAEIELPPDVDPYSPAVYERAATNFARLKEAALVLEAEPSLYFYQLRMGDHQQLGLAACYSLDEYDRDVIKKHERTRRDKEDDRTRHMMALGAQTGPVFLTYRASADVNDIATEVVAGEPLYEFVAADSVHHTLWRVPASPAPSSLLSSTPSRACRRCTSPMGIIERRALHARVRRCDRAARARIRLGMERMSIPFWPWPSPTIKCRSCRTTAP